MCGFDVDNFSSIATSDCAELPTSLMREVIYIMLARFLLSFLMEVLCICFLRRKPIPLHYGHVCCTSLEFLAHIHAISRKVY